MGKPPVQNGQLDSFEELEFQRGQRLKKIGQRQAESGVPRYTRECVSSAFRMLAREGRPFTFSPTREGYPNVYDLLEPATREILDRHRNYLGRIASVQSQNQFIKEWGRAHTLHSTAHGRRCIVWIIHPTAK